MLRVSPIVRFSRNCQTLRRPQFSSLSPFNGFASPTFGRRRFANENNGTKKWLSGVSAELIPRMDGDKLILSVKSINHGAQACASTTVNVGKLVDYREYKTDAPILKAYHSSELPLLDVIFRLPIRNSFDIKTPQLNGYRLNGGQNQWILSSVPNFTMEKYLVKPHQELKVGTDVASFTQSSAAETEVAPAVEDASVDTTPETERERIYRIGDHLSDYHIWVGAALGFAMTWFYGLDFFPSYQSGYALLAGTIFGAIVAGSPATAIYIFSFVLFIWLLALSAGLNRYK